MFIAKLSPWFGLLDGSVFLKQPPYWLTSRSAWSWANLHSVGLLKCFLDYSILYQKPRQYYFPSDRNSSIETKPEFKLWSVLMSQPALVMHVKTCFISIKIFRIENCEINFFFNRYQHLLLKVLKLSPRQLCGITYVKMREWFQTSPLAVNHCCSYCSFHCSLVFLISYVHHYRIQVLIHRQFLISTHRHRQYLWQSPGKHHLFDHIDRFLVVPMMALVMQSIDHLNIRRRVN